MGHGIQMGIGLAYLSQIFVEGFPVYSDYTCICVGRKRHPTQDQKHFRLRRETSRSFIENGIKVLQGTKLVCVV